MKERTELCVIREKSVLIPLSREFSILIPVNRARHPPPPLPTSLLLEEKVLLNAQRKHTAAFERPLTSPRIDRLASCENIVPRSNTKLNIPVYSTQVRWTVQFG